MTKLCVKWVPREITFKQKQRGVDNSKQCLKMIKRNKPEFLRRSVPMDETWLHYFTLNSNRQSSKWTAQNEPAPKCGKILQSSGKQLLHSVIGSLERRNCRKTAAFEEKESAASSRHAPCHKSVKTMAKIHELGFELLTPPPYSPDLAPSDYFLFTDLKRMLDGKKFSSNE
ncbi:histone-lysine N-methyltransferase SETMAR-like [Lepeophtheirus salmonis]|uniref:histone-lysine N-methyltransferase SETMAR-like n=1 Tax=Lepeophtheirus salmonis TaxID=72036 RepID=UPI003AF36367